MRVIEDKKPVLLRGSEGYDQISIHFELVKVTVFHDILESPMEEASLLE